MTSTQQQHQFVLTADQKKRIADLEREIEAKRVYDEKHRERKEKSSNRTGIPINMVDLDVIKIGTALGLIKKRTVLEGLEKEESGGNSLLDMFLGNEQAPVTYDLSKVPDYYMTIEGSISETEKIELTKEFVKSECRKCSDTIGAMIQYEMNNITNVIAITLENRSVDAYVFACNENMELVLECLEDEDDEEIWIQLRTLRNALLGYVSVCEYKTKLVEQIKILIGYGKSIAAIAKHLSWTDHLLSMFPGIESAPDGTDADRYRLNREIEIRYRTKNPELKPFNYSDILRHCCIPSMAIVPIKHLISTGLIGPYRHNSICYLDLGDDTYYILKDVVGGGIRLWVLDSNLDMFRHRFIQSLRTYTMKLFKTIYSTVYDMKTMEYIPSFWKSTTTSDTDVNIHSVFRNLLDSLEWLNNDSSVGLYIRELIKTRSTIIHTQLDTFNSFKSPPVAMSNSLSNSLSNSSSPQQLLLFQNIDDKEFRSKWPSLSN